MALSLPKVPTCEQQLTTTSSQQEKRHRNQTYQNKCHCPEIPIHCPTYIAEFHTLWDCPIGQPDFPEIENQQNKRPDDRAAHKPGHQKRDKQRQQRILCSKHRYH